MALFGRKEKKKKEEAAAEAAEPETPVAAQSGGGFFGRLKSGLSKTRNLLTTDVEDLFRGGVDDAALEELEERLVTADMGVETAMAIVEEVSRQARKISGPEQLKAVLRDALVERMTGGEPPPAETLAGPPHVVMVVGVNGVGKTTTIGKLAAAHGAAGRSVLVTAGDTFRAAAVEQLGVWAERAGADFVRGRDNADPAAVAFDGVAAGKARGKDIVFLDTAGRLHTRTNLMEELKKVRRALAKSMPDAPHETLLVLDATTGQNALQQARMFHEAIGLTGLVLTKLDGTARGGVVVSILSELSLPLRYIGVGEGIDDLQPFDPHRFAEALFA
jgi:fused signal recognition particle receptor